MNKRIILSGNEKQQEYAKKKIKLKKALQSKFFFEAIFIEYAIFEDRAESVLFSAGIKTTNKQGNPLGLSAKLNKIKDRETFQKKYIKKRLSNDLIEEIRVWKEIRDGLIHDLMNSQLREDELESTAIKGKELMDKFDSGVKSVKNYFIKQAEVDNK